jgi:glucose-6-phosphate isomerase
MGGAYQKAYRDLAGIYADEAAFDALVAEKGSATAYQVHEVHPAARSGDLIFGTTFMASFRSSLWMIRPLPCPWPMR